MSDQGKTNLGREAKGNINLIFCLKATNFELWLPFTTILLAPYFYLRPYGFDFSKGTSFSIVDFGLLLLLGLLLNEQRRATFRNMVSLEYSQIGLAFVASTVFAALIGRQLGGYDSPLRLWEFFSCLFQYSFIFIIFPQLALRYFSGDLHQLIRWIAFAYMPPMLIGLILCTYASPEILRGFFYFSNRAIGTYGNANSFAAVILIVLPYYTYLAAVGIGRWKLLGQWGQTISLLSLLLTGSISGLIVLLLLYVIFGLLVCWLVNGISWIKMVQFIWKALVQFVLMCGLLLLYASTALSDMFPRFLSVAVAFDAESSNSSVVGESGKLRIELLLRSLTTIADHFGNLIWGAGLGNSRFSSVFTFGNVQLDVHNIYLLLWLEGGLLSVLLYLTFLMAMLILVYRKGRREPAVAIPIGASIMALALYGLFNPHMYLRYYWIPLLPAFALARYHRVVK